MIDLHCHLLPGIDDGPQTMAEAVEMARIAVADGIRHSVLTSHVQPERWNNTRQTLEAGMRAFVACLADEGVPLGVTLGAEARICAELVERVQEDQVPFLGEVDGFRILLLEFPHAIIPPGSDRLLTALLRMKVRPLIAHPERNKMIMQDPARLRPFIDLGCWLQVTAGSFAGQFGPRAESLAFELLESGAWCVMATDAHDGKDRPPRMSAGHAAVSRRMGAELADQMTRHRPARIVGLHAAATGAAQPATAPAL